jgi:hypothetical protein
MYWRNSRSEYYIIKMLYLTWELSPAIINIFLSIFRKCAGFVHFHHNVKVVWGNYPFTLVWVEQGQQKDKYIPNKMGWFDGVVVEQISNKNLFFSLYPPFSCKIVNETLYKNYMAWFELHTLFFPLLTVWWCYLRFGKWTEVSKNEYKSQ